MQTIDYDKPTIFPPSVLAGVTLRNTDRFPPYGLSLLPAKILSVDEARRQRREFADAVGVDPDRLQFQNQVHGTTVRVIERTGVSVESDGMVTASGDVVLCVSIADCAAVLLYDPVHRCAAGLHSGWRGTHGNITAAGIAVMREHFDTKPDDLLAYVSACASGERYVVRADVADLFPDDAKRALGGGEWLLDIRTQIRRQLLDEGVQPGAIELSEACTMDDERYHSFRRDGGKSGRMVAFIGLRGER